MNTFLDPYVADEAKQKAMQQVYEAAPEKWRMEARQAVFLVAYLLPEFCSDHIWKVLYKPPEPRALGPVLASLARQGVVEKTGKQRQTAQVSRHYTDVNVWKSLVYGKAPPEWHPTLSAWKQVL